jgi:hypothetical protein
MTDEMTLEQEPEEAPKAVVTLPAALDQIIEDHHVATFHNRFRAATNQLKVRLAAFLTNKE